MGLESMIRNGSILKGLTKRLASVNSSSSKVLFVEPLKNRSLLRVTGNQVHEYLQGLITNDMNHLNGTSDSMYAMFLNGKGRVLYDTIIYKIDVPHTYIIEGDSSALNSLKKHLMLYRVRRNISVEEADDLNLWVINKDLDLINKCNEDGIKTASHILRSSLNNCLVCCDPRLSNLGVRIVAPRDMNVIEGIIKAMPGHQVQSKKFYKSLRYKLGIGEGVTELTTGQSFPLEANCDYLNGVSFHKGCYIGQELTARTYHTGVVRKRLMPINFIESCNLNENDIPVFLEDATEKAIGKLRGMEGQLGIALLRIEQVLKSPKLRILDKLCTTSRPFWWPTQDYAEQKKIS